MIRAGTLKNPFSTATPSGGKENNQGWGDTPSPTKDFQIFSKTIHLILKKRELYTRRHPKKFWLEISSKRA
jgi:hypothetical protein